MTRPIRGMAEPPTARSRDFRGSAIRLLKRLAPQRRLTALVIALAVGGIAIGVIGPRILGHATDLLFNGVIGRELPAGLSKEQAIEAARARGDGHLRRSAVRHERDARPRCRLHRRRAHPVARTGPVSDCRTTGLDAGTHPQRGGAAHHGGHAHRGRAQGAPAAAVLRRRPAARRTAQPGHQRCRQRAVLPGHDHQPIADLAADGGGGAGDDGDDLAAAGADHSGDGAGRRCWPPGPSPAARRSCSSRSGPTPGGSTPTSRRPTAVSPW